MTPSQTVVPVTTIAQPTSVTFIASFLSNYGGLPCPGTTITTSGTVWPVGELGQGIDTVSVFGIASADFYV